MSARVWNVGDPEPADHPPLVDCDGVTWLWAEDHDYGFGEYVRQMATDHGGGVMTGWRTSSWEFLDEYMPLREATRSEVANFYLIYEKATGR